MKELLIDTTQQVLPVMESFYTLQGEGFHQGRAAYFIRLGGCDVGCAVSYTHLTLPTNREV